MIDLKLFRWSSEYLKNYRNGDILVMASSSDDARQLAMEEFHRYDRKRYEYDYFEGFGGDEDIAARLAVFQKDIEKEPEVIEPPVLFLTGSE